VLPIGGLKEKLLAALRTGIKTVIIPAENEKDLAEIPDNVKTGLEIRPVSMIDEVLKIALVRQPTPVVWEEPEETPQPIDKNEGPDDPVVTH
jgi:ATP-dependent Lon protease